MKNNLNFQATLGVKPFINGKNEIDIRVQFLCEYIHFANAKGLVLGISGGQDSTLAGKISQMAVEKLRDEGYNAKFYALRLPYGKQSDEEDAQLALDFIKPDVSLSFNIKETVDSFVNTFNLSNSDILSDFDKGNVKARTRMTTQYAFAGMYNLLVVGTDHAAEAVTGFFTKFGDGGADILPLSGLTKTQGRELLVELNAKPELYLKKPTADLLDDKPQQSDETELGVSYDDIDNFLTGNNVSTDVFSKLSKRYQMTEHKRQLPVTPFDEWWKN